MSFRSLASLRVAVSFAALLVLSACSDNRQAQLSAVETIDIPAANAGQQTNQNIGNPTLVIPDTFPVAEGDELTLVFSEEFDGPNIRPEVWFFESGDGSQYGIPGWGNNELEYYLPDNAMIVNGVLEITARRETVGDFNYTSARINTRDRFAFQYGRIEASIKLPAGQGLWPAFWMLSQDSDYICGVDDEGNDRPCIWAATGEIDIMEAVNLGGTGGNEILGTLHYGGESPANVFTGETYTPSVDVTEDFHTYSLEWDEDEIRWYFDGLLYAVQNSWYSTADNGGPGAPFNQPFHILLNLAVGGNLPGSPNGTTPFPATMEVDWVRVYSGEDPDGGVATEPNASAPTPTEDAAGVISLFSDAYDDIAGIDYNPFWNQATVVTIAQIAGNKMLKYAGLDYQGTDFAGNPQDVSDKGYLHLDFWTADSTALNVYLISPGDPPVETSYELTGDIAPNSWVSVNIPLTEFAGVDLTNLIQLKFVGNGTIFLDNLYFGGEAPATGPTAAATTPTEDAGDVVSLFSNAYTDVAVGDFSTTWDTADVSDVQVAGDDVKLYVPTGGNATLGFIGINFDNANAIDGTGYDTLRMDIWTPDVTNLLVKLVDFGGDGFGGTAADSTGTSTQTLTTGSWQTISIPFSEFLANGLTNVTELSQIVLEDLDGAAGGTTLYVDNLYFFNSAGAGGGGGTAPTAAATTPTADAGDVVSLFSNAYTDVAVGDFSTTWDTADVSDVQVAGDDVKLYVPTGGNATLGFIGINFDNANAIDGTGYDTLRMDIWTPDVTNLLVKLVDFGGDGFGGTAADSTGTSTQTLTTGSWQTISIPFSEFLANGLTNVTELSQIVLEDLDGAAGGTTLYVDNLYFFNSAGAGGGGGTAPTAAATTPTADAGDVVSLFSNAYTDVAVGDFSTTWDTADVSDVQVAGDDVKLYVPTGGNATLGFIGINFDNANAIDGTGYDTLRMDIWTPDVTNLLVKLVDFGGDGFGGTAADSTGTSTQTLTTGSWQTISIPFSEFLANGLTNVTELSQIVLEDLDGAAGGTTLYVDNLYFFNSAGAGGGGGTAPTAAATTPTADAGDVVSLFSNAYTDVAVGDFSTTWDTADVSDVQVAGDDVKLYVPTGGNATLGFIGINFDNANAIDGTGYDTLRMDIWTPDVTNLLVKLVDFGGDGFGGTAADSTGTSTQTLTTGSWQTISIPFSEFLANGLTNVTELSQIVLEDLDGAAGGTTLYVDNLYFFNSAGAGGGGGTAPTAAATTPTADAGDVVSLFSNAYTDVAVGDFSTTWDTADVSDVQVAGDDVKLYVPTGGNATLGFIGINFDNANAIDGTGYDTLRMDIWTPDVTNLLVKLVDFGGDGFGGTAADSTGTSTQTLTTGSWQTISIPFSEFLANGLTNVTELSQIVLEDLDGAAGGTTLYVDNLYFFNSAGAGGGGGTAPTAAATTPTADAGDVVSLFSNAYTDVAVGDFSTTWDTADVSDVQVAGDDVKLYVPTGGNATLGFIGINFDNANAIDGTGYDTLRMDIWTPDVTNLLVKLVDFGGDGFGGTAADSTGTSTQTLTTGSWQTISIPFSEFLANGLTNVTELSQIVLEDLDGAAGGTTLYVDNLYFFNSAGAGGGGGTAPTAAATTPTADAGDVVSLFSNAYTDVAVGDFSTTWDTADVSDVQVAGDDVKLYVPTGGNATLGFIGINFDNANAIDGTGYDTLRMDIWTPDVTNLLVKLVDFGGDGFGGTAADSTGTSTQTLTTGSWQTISIPFSEFLANGLTNVTELSQIVLEDLDGAAGGTTLYVDNLYFFNSAGAGGGGGTAPTAAATTPTADAGDVVSLFSNAYTDVAVGDFSTTWDTADVSDVQVAGDDVKLYVPTGGNATLGFIGINFDNANAIDGTGYDTLRMDIWTPDVTNLLVKLVDFGGDGFGGTAADSTGTSTQTLTTGSWQTISIPFSEFLANGLTNVTELSQIVLEDLDGAAGGTTLYVDNLYFFNSAGAGGGGEIAVNGGFENGDLSNWALFPVNAADPNEQTVVITNPKTGTYAGRINNTTPASASIIKQANLTPVSIGQTATITFSARGSLGVGGVAFAEFFTEVSGGGTSSSQILGGAPLTLDADENVWADFSFVVPIATDVSGGVTLQLTGTTGGDGASFADVYYDDISIVITD